MKYKCVSDHVEELAGGRLVAPGEFVDLTKTRSEDPHNAALIGGGKLVPAVKEAGNTRSSQGKED